MTAQALLQAVGKLRSKSAAAELNPNAFVRSPLASFGGPMVQQALHPTYTLGQGFKDLGRGGLGRASHFMRAAMPGGGHAGGASWIDNIGAGLFRDNHPLWDRRNITEPFKRMQADPGYQHATRQTTGLMSRYRLPGMQGDSFNEVFTNRLLPDFNNHGGPFGVSLPPWWNSYLNTGAGGPMTSRSLGQSQAQSASQGLRGFRNPVESSPNVL